MTFTNVYVCIKAVCSAWSLKEMEEHISTLYSRSYQLVSFSTAVTKEFRVFYSTMHVIMWRSDLIVGKCEICIQMDLHEHVRGWGAEESEYNYWACNYLCLRMPKNCWKSYHDDDEWWSWSPLCVSNLSLVVELNNYYNFL